MILPFYYERTKNSPYRSEKDTSDNKNESKLLSQIAKIMETAYLNILKKIQVIDGKPNDVNLMNVFEGLDKKRQGYIEISDVEFLLQRHGYITIENTG